MRINRYIALCSGLSRRQADELIKSGRIKVNGRPAVAGQTVNPADENVTLAGQPITVAKTVILKLNKPPGYIVSRQRQGRSPTVYSLLPLRYKNLKPVGRLDKDSCGLLLLTNDGQLAHRLTHPGYRKEKVYRVELDHPLSAADLAKLNNGIKLEDGLSRLKVSPLNKGYEIRMQEGRNRQIRRTFGKLGYKVTYLCRCEFGEYKLGKLKSGGFRSVTDIL